MRKNDFLYLKTEKMINNGFCLARYNGKIVLVNKCLPEEEVLAKIVKVRRDYIEAEAIEIIESSKYRIEPKCKYFGLCGGCKLQDILYEKQLEIKKEFVNDDFIRIGINLKRKLSQNMLKNILLKMEKKLSLMRDKPGLN